MRSEVAREKELYEPIRQCLEDIFREKFGNCHLETTSTGFSEEIKGILETDVLLYLSKEGLHPDLMGYVTKDRSKRIIVVEIKKGHPRIKDIYQTKMYAELFGAYYVLLISSEPIPEETRRLLARKPHLCSHSAGFKAITIGQFSVDEGEILEDSWLPPLFEFE